MQLAGVWWQSAWAFIFSPLDRSLQYTLKACIIVLTKSFSSVTGVTFLLLLFFFSLEWSDTLTFHPKNVEGTFWWTWFSFIISLNPSHQVDSMDNFTTSNTPSREDDQKSHLKSRSRSPSMASDMEPIEVRQLHIHSALSYRDSSCSYQRPRDHSDIFHDDLQAWLVCSVTLCVEFKCVDMLVIPTQCGKVFRSRWRHCLTGLPLPVVTNTIIEKCKIQRLNISMKRLSQRDILQNICLVWIRFRSRCSAWCPIRILLLNPIFLSTHSNYKNKCDFQCEWYADTHTDEAWRWVTHTNPTAPPPVIWHSRKYAPVWLFNDIHQ